MIQVPTNRKARIAAIRTESTADDVLQQIFIDDPHPDVIRAIIQRPLVPEKLLQSIYDWSLEAGDSKFGPTYEGTNGAPRFFPDDPKKEYEAYQSRYAILSSFGYREQLPEKLAEQIAMDSRLDQIGAMLAARGHLSEEFILKLLEYDHPRRKYFFIFPKNNSVKVRARLIDILEETQDRQLLESFIISQKPTPDENNRIKEIFPSLSTQESDEERNARVDDALEYMNSTYMKLFEDFYRLRPALYYFRTVKESDRICPFDLERGEFEKKSWQEMMDEFTEPLRAEYLRFGRNVTVDQMKTALVEDYFLAAYYLAHRPNLPVEVIEKFFQEEDGFFHGAVAANPTVPYEIARRVLTHPDPGARVGLSLRQQIEVRDAISLLQDPVAMVRESIFNENDLLPVGYRHFREFVNGSIEEYEELVKRCPPSRLPHLAYPLGRAADPKTIRAADFLGSHFNPKVRIEFIRGPRQADFFSAISPETVVKLAGDKLIQIRKHTFMRAFHRDVQQGDIPRLLADTRVSQFQKMVLAAVVTDRKVFETTANHPSDWVKLGAYFNWKATASDRNSIQFDDPNFSSKAKTLMSERNAVGDDVTRDPYPDFFEERERPSIFTLIREEQDAYWGGKFPRFEEDVSE
jgi:hypothetical protein